MDEKTKLNFYRLRSWKILTESIDAKGFKNPSAGVRSIFQNILVEGPQYFSKILGSGSMILFWSIIDCILVTFSLKISVFTLFYLLEPPVYVFTKTNIEFLLNFSKVYQNLRTDDSFSLFLYYHNKQCDQH